MRDRCTPSRGGHQLQGHMSARSRGRSRRRSGRWCRAAGIAFLPVVSLTRRSVAQKIARLDEGTLHFYVTAPSILPAQMKRFLKWVGYIIGGFVLLILIA